MIRLATTLLCMLHIIQGRVAEEAQVILLTDRLHATSALLNSICEHSSIRVRLHLVVPDARLTQFEEDLDVSDTCIRAYDDVSSSIEQKKLNDHANYRKKLLLSRIVRILNLSTIVHSMKTQGLPLSWEDTVPKTELTVHTAAWDHSPKHSSVFNCLRFYLGLLPEFEHLESILFLDDDVLLTGDIAQYWHIQQDAPMSAGCMNWLWHERCGKMVQSYSASYLDVPYFGFGVLRDGRSIQNATCTSAKQRECAPPGFFDSLREAATQNIGLSKPVTLEYLRTLSAWNFGINLFNLTSWRSHKITQKYIAWTKANQHYGWFSSTSLAYGLGLGYLAFVDNPVQCLDTGKFDILHGLGHVMPDELASSGIEISTLSKDFHALHWNGDRKPWDFYEAINEYSPHYLRHSSYLRQQRRTLSTHRASRSFMVWTQPRSGSEWFMNILDHHPNVCASGEGKLRGGRGWPRESLQPYREPREQSDICIPKSVCHWTVMLRLLLALLDEIDEEEQQQEASVTTAMMISKQLKMPRRCWSKNHKRDHKSTDIYGDHFKAACALLERAVALSEVARIWDVDNRQTWLNRVIRCAHHLFVTHILTASSTTQHLQEVGINTTNTFNHTLTLPCSCPRNTTVAGLKYMTGWIKYPRNLETHMRIRRERFTDILDTHRALGTRVIILDRRNLARSYISLIGAQSTNQFHCTESIGDCKYATKVKVEPTKLLSFIRRNTKHRHDRNALIQAYDIPMLHLEYESCVAHLRTCVSRVLTFLDVDRSSEVVRKLVGVEDYTQNPLSMRDRIANFDEVVTALDQAGLADFVLEES